MFPGSRPCIATPLGCTWVGMWLAFNQKNTTEAMLVSSRLRPYKDPATSALVLSETSRALRSLAILLGRKRPWGKWEAAATCRDNPGAQPTVRTGPQTVTQRLLPFQPAPSLLGHPGCLQILSEEAILMFQSQLTPHRGVLCHPCCSLSKFLTHSIVGNYKVEVVFKPLSSVGAYFIAASNTT